MRYLRTLLAFLILAGCDNQQSTEQPTGRPPADVDGARLISADSEPGNWMTYGRTYKEERYSPLDQINVENVGDLSLAWYFDLNSTRGSETTPLVVDGVMYTTGIWNIIHALDAKTGEELWNYDPEVRRDWIRYSCCDGVNRGPAVWKGKVYIGTLDGRLVAVDAANGELVWEVQTTDRDQPYSITGAPRVVNGKVIIGNGGAEFGLRGYASAYDAETGEMIWRFWTVPGNPADGFESETMEMAAKTWAGEWWKYGGGGTVWDCFSYDPETNLLFMGTGNGAVWSRDIRSPGGGDNLFLASIVAVDADTGEYAWHYQTTPAENWDYNAAQQMILTDLEINGEMRKVLLQAPKNGFFYVIDRVTGELISAQPYVKTTWASHVDMETGRPVEIPENVYSTEVKIISPAPWGGHGWQPMSYSPQTGLVYIPAQETEYPYSHAASYEMKKWQWNMAFNTEAEKPERKMQASGALLAWNPVTNSEVWRIPRGGMWNGGTLATGGGLLLQGDNQGGLYIYRADTGQQLAVLDMQTAAIAAPIAYTVDGEQYIAISAGWGGTVALVGDGLVPTHTGTRTRMLAFKLGGTATLPPPPPPAPIPEQPESTASAEVIDEGFKLYHQFCANCHGGNAMSGGSIPDLRHLAPETHESFNNIVLRGERLSGGMSAFGDVLSEADAEALHAYVISRAAAE